MCQPDDSRRGVPAEDFAKMFADVGAMMVKMREDAFRQKLFDPVIDLALEKAEEPTTYGQLRSYILQTLDHSGFTANPCKYICEMLCIDKDALERRLVKCGFKVQYCIDRMTPKPMKRNELQEWLAQLGIDLVDEERQLRAELEGYYNTPRGNRRCG